MFILDRPGADKPTYIFLKVTLSDGSFKESLSLKILPAMWDKTTQRATTTCLDKATAEENRSINALLGRVYTFIETRTRDARFSGNHLTCAEMASKLQELTGRKRHKKAEAGFYDHCEAIIEDMRSGIILTPYGKRYSKDTTKCYDLYLRNFKSYDPTLTWGAITLDFYRSFIKWCNDQDFSLNYIGQHINKLIVLMKEARKRGHHNNTAYLDPDFRRMREDTDDISLSPAEMDIIAEKHLPNELWDIARDWFVIGSHLGLRVSDVSLLDEKQNVKDDYVTIVNEKTDTKVVVPISDRIKKIIKKWGGLPPKMSDVEINRYIKKVCELCKINGIVLYFLTKGGERKDFYIKKYEMVSCHTMRRYFITTLLNMGVSDNQVMQLAGIRKHATLLRYKKTKPEETATILKDHVFFRGK